MKINRLYGKALTAAAHSANSARCETEAPARKPTACTARLLLADAHSARSTRSETSADCMKLNRLRGKALAVCCISSSFRLSQNRSGLHEAQPLVRQSSPSAAHQARSTCCENETAHKTQTLARQSSCCPLHIKLVPPDAKPKQTARKSTGRTAKLSPSAAYPASPACRKTEAVSQNSTACTARLLLAAL